MSAPQIQSLRIERRTAAGKSLAPPEERALDWSFHLFRLFHAVPEQETDLHDGVLVAIIPEDDPEVAALNLQAARQARRRGQPVAFRFVDAQGHLAGGELYEFSIDLRDESWEQEPRPEFNGQSVTELRQDFHAIVENSQHEGPLRFAYENIVVLNGVRVYILDEPEPGVYDCIAFARNPF